MYWLIDHQRIWRSAGLLLLLVAFSGPWAFDRINVPMPYTCSLPNVRLDENFCGLPLSFARIAFMFLGSLGAIARRLASGEAHPGEFVFVFVVLLYLFPLVSGLELIRRVNSRRWQLAHIAALCVTVLSSIIFALNSLPQPHLALWGIWLYIVVAAWMILAEVLVIRYRGQVAEIELIVES
jgi:hypothetical protein